MYKATISLDFIIKVTYHCPVLALLEVLREGNFQSDSESKNKTRSRTTEMKSVSFLQSKSFFRSIKNRLNCSVVEWNDD